MFVNVLAEATYSKLPENYWENPEPYNDSESERPFHSRVEKLTWENDHKTAMVRSKEWKLIASDAEKPELYFMDAENIARKNLFGDPQYNDIYEKLKKAMQSNTQINFIWE